MPSVCGRGVEIDSTSGCSGTEIEDIECLSESVDLTSPSECWLCEPMAEASRLVYRRYDRFSPSRRYGGSLASSEVFSRDWTCKDGVDGRSPEGKSD